MSEGCGLILVEFNISELHGLGPLGVDIADGDGHSVGSDGDIRSIV